MNKDLTMGKPEKVLWQFTLPLFGSVIFQQMYNIADSLVAGKFVGEDALAAVGNSYEITLIYLAFAFGCNIGCSVVVSQFFGGKKWKDLKSAVTTTFISSGILCVVLTLLGILLCKNMLQWIHTPENIFADSKLYLYIYTAGLIFLFFYNIATGIFTALGDSKTPFLFLAISSTVNVGMNILFVAGFKMGVAGVAWATFLCQGASCIASLIVLAKRMKSIPCKEKCPLFSKRIFKRLVAIAVPSILQQSFISIGNILIQSRINGFGSGVIAGYAAAIKLNNLVITTFTTMGNAMSNFTAQNIGAGKTDRVKKGFLAGLKMTYVICIPLVVLYFFAGQQAVSLFLTSDSGEAVETGILFLRIVSPFYFIISTKLVADGVLRGAGAMNQFMIATFIDLILRVALAFIFSAQLGATGIWCAWPIGWTIAMILSVLFYKKGVWLPKIPDSNIALRK